MQSAVKGHWLEVGSKRIGCHAARLIEREPDAALEESSTLRQLAVPFGMTAPCATAAKAEWGKANEPTRARARQAV